MYASRVGYSQHPATATDPVPRSTRVLALPDGLGAAQVFARATGAAVERHRSLGGLIGDLGRLGADHGLLSLGAAVPVGRLADIAKTAFELGVSVGFLDGWRGARAAERHAAGLATWRSTRAPGATVWLEELSLAALRGDHGRLRVAGSTDLALGRDDPDHRVLGLITHGNGIDAPFGGEVLCGLRDARADGPLDRYFPCGAGGPCIRSGTVTGNGTGPLLRAPSTLGGDVVVWGTCYGVLASDAIFDPRGGLLRGLLDNAVGPRQVLTTYKSWHMDDVALLAACLLADNGVPLGKIVHLLNAASMPRLSPGDAPPWILVGDPAATVGVEQPLLDHLDEVGNKAVGIARTADSGKDRLAILAGENGEPGEPGNSGQLWLAPVPGNPYVVWVRNGGRPDGGSPGRLTVAHLAEDERYRWLRRIWGSSDRLAFTQLFFASAAAGSAGFAYRPEIAELVAGTQARFAALQPILADGLGLSGPQSELETLASSESEAWEGLNRLLHGLLIEYVRRLGGVIDHAYLPAMLAGGPGAPTTCRYCGSPASTELLRLPTGAVARRIVRCPRCAVVVDCDISIGAIWLDGPEQVVTGHHYRYQLRLENAPDNGVQHISGSLLLQPFPGAPDESGIVATAHPAGPGETLELEWRVPPDVHSGVYFLVAPVLVDGAVMTARRPIRIA